MSEEYDLAVGESKNSDSACERATCTDSNGGTALEFETCVRACVRAWDDHKQMLKIQWTPSG